MNLWWIWLAPAAAAAVILAFGWAGQQVHTWWLRRRT